MVAFRQHPLRAAENFVFSFYIDRFTERLLCTDGGVPILFLFRYCCATFYDLFAPLNAGIFINILLLLYINDEI